MAHGGNKNRKLTAACRADAEGRRSATPLRVDPISAIQETLDNAVADLRYAQYKVDQLPQDEFWRDSILAGKIPNEWVRYRDDKLSAVATIANSMVRNGIAERAVQVAEARAAMMVAMVKQAAERAGLSQVQVRSLGSELRAIAAEHLEREVAA